MKNIKILSLVTTTAVALVALLGASSASANWFASELTTTTIEGSRTGSDHVLNLAGEQFSCKNTSFTGIQQGSKAEQVTSSPELQSCIRQGFSSGWAMNGCKFRFNAGAGPLLLGSMDITGCESPMSTSYSGCTVQIGNQSGIGSVEYLNVLNEGKDAIVAIANLKNLTFTRSGGSCDGAPGTFSNGTYKGEWIIKGSAPSYPVSVALESTYPVPGPFFATEEASGDITGVRNSNEKMLAFSGATLQCENYTLAGSVASAIQTTFTATPSFKGCRMLGASIPDAYVSAGGCNYVFHANGKFDIGGATCAGNPISITAPGCVITVGPQSNLSSWTYVNEGSGKQHSVSITGGPTGLTYTESGLKCPEQGTFSNGNVKGLVNFTADRLDGSQQGFWFFN